MAPQKYWIRVGIVVLIGIVIWVVSLSSKQLARNERIENEVSLLQNEANKIRRENETLGEKINYFSSADFREQEAKEKLGMKKQGEEVVVIKARPEQIVSAQPTEREKENVALGEYRPNYKKWWDLFFGTAAH